MGKNVDEGIVAVWFGNFDTKGEFQKYIKVHYELEENTDSEFERDFELKYYDRALVESKFMDKKSSDIAELLSGLSYYESFDYSCHKLPKVEYNAIIVIYDFEYKGNGTDVSDNNNVADFCGNMHYEKVVDLSWMGL